MASRFGLSVALTTPFDASGRIVIPLMTAHARACLDAGCNSVTLFGTTGEGASVGTAERQAVIDAMLASGISADQLVAGVLVDAAEDAAEQCRQALQRGARNILLAPPSYFKNVGDDGLFGWFAAVFAALGPLARGMLLYNIPSVTTVQLSLDLIGRLRRAYPGVVAGVKDSGGDWAYSEAVLKTHGDLIILIGDERHLAPAVRIGGQGAISGMANFAAGELRAMIESGRDDSRVEGFVLELLRHPVIPAVKAMVARQTGDERWLTVRPPLEEVALQQRQQLGAAYDRLFSTQAA
ncbi:MULTISPECIES: dihydrodipicolinate synthase family protein [unclassified Mesorhizobium]|uniref:dihydrodipicolinate synthase family protein n=1 Tax=unclassified Mesorhizobium TaxID=325217 RepID=UPI000F764F0C|nr:MULTISPECIES: dihydrodipicolinate synthase family protein [unclassified Mesorhizobium]AZO21405.1 dihydrodipicolinate synthase family protein [Mesorhizobium sp. M1E.F.Ca.ET.045.02.1.1]RUW32316.1 dihydrodipicolinate synthase family protein [Mesorhizobium sp. M1E.F.Ca.ET.041.01.1.1]RUW82064.1 dihydrodipicolinate synthase family protein [Mesorhizobium sp. M1E.F.Ca.ET.063.01.1.1]RWD91348.1 MAG: dihydrodipicolinate synthase family protein [Mesorhizobium sp.]RWD94635.1 MAG: dihydrodipicolinate syn